MAESSVAFLLNELSRVLREEVNLQRGVRLEIELIKAELESISAFLRVADAKEENDPQLAVWVKQVRDVAFDIEDILDAFSLHFADRDADEDRCSGFRCLKKIASSYKKWKAKHQIGSELQSIKTRVKDISERHQRYDSGHDFLEQGSSSRMATMEAINQFRRNALLEDESQLVGTEEPKQKLINWLLHGDSSLKVLAVTGMGGLGKTALVNQIYNSGTVKDQFQSGTGKDQFQRRALVTVSESLKQEELLRELIRQLSPPDDLPPGIGAMDSHSLKQTMKELLQNKRYLIVLDDVWKTEHWDQLKFAMPRNNCGSRVIITTRITEVGRYSCTEGMIHYLQPLSDSDSWTLFCKKTFRAESCPPHLECICEQIIKKCGGVPLALSTISGLLATKDVDRVEVWKMIQRSLNVELQENTQLQMMKRILSLSFYDLPYYLKSCFLFLSIFPEDHLIERTRLVRLWISEGFVEKKVGRTLEEVSESYFHELLNRNLIQAIKITLDGRVKTCRIHDFLRETILSMSREQNFIEVINRENATRLPEGARRLSIHLHEVDMYHFKSSLLSKLRSLFLFEVGDTLSNGSTMSKLFSCGLKLLKVLDLRGAHLETFPGEISALFLLRYLSLRNTRISSLPISIGNLQFLETLDLVHTYVTMLPSEISKLHKLRHLMICHYEQNADWTSDPINMRKFTQSSEDYIIKGFKACGEIGGLLSLQTLCYLDASSQSSDFNFIMELGRLAELRKLRLINLRGQQGAALCSSISKMRYLCSLTLHTSETIDLEDISSPPTLLQRLYLIGRLAKLPSWLSSLHNLEVLHLRYSQLKEDPFKSLQNLPSLTVLEFMEATIGEVMIVPPGCFPRLKSFYISQYHKKLKFVLVAPNALPRVQHIIFNGAFSATKISTLNTEIGITVGFSFINDSVGFVSQEQWSSWIKNDFADVVN